jgi:1,4-dihydroxy-2-naphthoyl-CoA synthase
MPIPKFKNVLYEETGGVATVTLNRPDRLNAIRVGMYEEIAEAILYAAWNKEVGVSSRSHSNQSDAAKEAEQAFRRKRKPKLC